jgi:HK97 family phage prohead protease
MIFTTPFEIKSSTEKGYFEGYGAVFGNEDAKKDIILPGAFTKSLAEFEKKGEMPMMLWNHNDDEPIGDWLGVEEDSKGLLVKGQLWLDQGITNAARAYKVMTGRGKKGLSIGYRTKEADRDKQGRRLLKQVELAEISPVTFPMNSEATVLRVKSANGEIDPRTLERLLRDECGLSAREAKALMSGGMKALLSQEDRDDTSDELKQLTKTINQLFT